MPARLASGFVLFLAAACATTAATVAPDAQLCDATFAPTSGKIDGVAAKKLVAEGAKLVDVRAPDYYAREHIAGAINIPVAEIASRAANDIGGVSTPVVLYCRTGAGSAKAAATLREMGYVAVYDLGSYLNWGEGAPAPTPLPPSAAN